MEGPLGWGRQEEVDGWRKGPWTSQEDKLLVDHVTQHGEGRWNSVSKLAGLKRSGRSCRLRWVNYLRPDLKRGGRRSLAASLAGRTTRSRTTGGRTSRRASRPRASSAREPRFSSRAKK
ncbi:unnamed protein product [Miscanthus lutarioriparius]|uniref:Uncharacterized protein n=1 Tax=Miscanthus lutarioriparius TaxID=422564 RepID=A0A811R144_9POAL|nr:unnamed protein product [Miscanthus lutarioriparius]